jgi:hypothetical protein
VSARQRCEAPGRPCKRRATTESGRTLCPDHRREEDQATFRDDSPGARAAERELLRGLKPPPGRSFQLLALPGELFDLMPWQGHRVEVLAVPLADDSRYPDLHPWVFDRFPKIKGPCIVVRWRIGQPPRPGFLEVTWSRLPPPRPIRHLVDASGTLDTTRVSGLWDLWTHDVQAPVPKRGRLRLEDEPWPHWREQADTAINLRAHGYSWPDIRRRNPTPTRTLQTWVTRRRKELTRRGGG